MAGDTPLTEAPALLKDIYAGFYGSNPSYLTESQGYIYFAAASADGNALWRTDGAEANTTIVKAFPNANLTFTDNLVAANGMLYFFVRDNFNVVSLWKSNGTEVGTTMVTELDYGSTAIPTNLVIAGGQLFFFMDDGVHGNELWTSNGTAAGTKLVKDINGASSSSLNYGPETPVAVGDTIYFAANDGSTGYQLWSSDGTEEGTQLVLDSGLYGFSPSRMLEFNDALYFFAYDSNQRYTLWRSDGTSAGTQRVSDVSVRSTFSTLIEFNNEIYFTGGGSLNGGWELWKSDGTLGNAVQVTDINPGNLSANVSKVTPAGDTLFFVADDGVHGEELWISDGTVGNATMAADILPNGLFPSPWASILVAAKNEDAVYFTVLQDDTGRELWRSDGTSEGTYLVVDIYPGVADSNPAEITAINNKVVFSATDGTYGKELRVATIGLPLNQPPNVHVGGPYFGDEGGTVQLDATGTTDDRNAPNELSYQWDLDEDGEFDDAIGATPIMSLAELGGPDVIEVSVKVTDLDGAATVRSITLAIQNLPPTLSVNAASIAAKPGTVLVNSGTYSDVPADQVTLAASIGTIVDNLDGTWSWSWDSTGQAVGTQTVTITAADGATLTQKTFDMTVLSPPNAYLTVNDKTATTDPFGETPVLPSSLEAINEFSEFTVNVWTRVDSHYAEDLTDISLNLNYNSVWFQLKTFTPGDGIGALSVHDTGGGLQISAGQLASGDLGRSAYLLVGSFRFQPNPAGGISNDSDNSYPEAVEYLQFAISDIELTFDVYGAVPGEQVGSPATRMQVVTYDTDDDGTISLIDMTYVIRRLGNSVESPNNYRFDFDQDGVVSLLDLTYLIRNLGLGVGNGSQIRFPVIQAQTTSFGSPQASSLLEAEAISPASAPTASLLEGEGSTSQALEAENVDAAFGNLGALSHCWDLPLEDDTEETLRQAISLDQLLQPPPITDWALQASTVFDSAAEKAISLLDELEEEHPRLGGLVDWWKNRLENL